MNPADYPNNSHEYDAVIDVNTSLSADVPIYGTSLVGIIVPAGWTAANLTFQVSIDGVTFFNFYKADGTEYTVVTGGAARCFCVPAADFLPYSHVKVRSGTSGSAVNQPGAVSTRTLQLITVFYS